jgi:Uma2 family endonuclease
MTLIRSKPDGKPQPAWDIALLYPDQGNWSESDYLIATETTNRLVELSDGVVQVLPMPKTSHQLIVQYLHGLLVAFVTARKLGTVLFAPLRVRLWEGVFREPDIVFMLARHAKRIGEDFWDGADLVIEVVSGSAEDRRRDLVVKRREYAKAGIDEYWIVDPKDQRILVLKRKGRSYVTHAEARARGRVESALLRGLEVDALDVFSAGSTPQY